MNYLVSVIIPIYNMAESLEKCVQSIVQQDYKNIEIVLVDDGSTDGSWEVCNNLSKIDSRIRAFHTVNQGSGPARNVGIANSRGDYLYFPDADDYLEPNAISTVVNATINGFYDLVVFGFKSVTRGGKLLFKKEYKPFSNTGNAIRTSYSDYFAMNTQYGIQGAPWNKLFSGKIIRDNEIMYPALRRHQDEGFISRYMCHSKNVVFIPNVLYTYYLNTSNMEYNKYPVNYDDSVIGLYQIWSETILKWNPDDYVTHNMVGAEYLSKLIKSIELSYSSKAALNAIQRRSFVKSICKKSQMASLKFNLAGSLYQRIVLLLTKLHFYSLLTGFAYLGVMKLKKRQG